MLTRKQEAFCQAFFKTDNASEAYRAAYDTSNSKPNSIHRAAHGLLKNAKVVARIKELKDILQERYKLTVDDIIDELQEARDIAKVTSQPSSMVSASLGKAKVLGFLTDKVELKGAFTLEGLYGRVSGKTDGLPE